MRGLLVEDNDDDALLIRESLSETTVEIGRAKRLSTALEQLTREGLTPSYWIFRFLTPGDWRLSAVCGSRQHLCRSSF